MEPTYYLGDAARLITDTDKQRFLGIINDDERTNAINAHLKEKGYTGAQRKENIAESLNPNRQQIKLRSIKKPNDPNITIRTTTIRNEIAPVQQIAPVQETSTASPVTELQKEPTVPQREAGLSGELGPGEYVYHVDGEARRYKLNQGELLSKAQDIINSELRKGRVTDKRIPFTVKDKLNSNKDNVKTPKHNIIVPIPNQNKQQPSYNNLQPYSPKPDPNPDPKPDPKSNQPPSYNSLYPNHPAKPIKDGPPSGPPPGVPLSSLFRERERAGARAKAGAQVSVTVVTQPTAPAPAAAPTAPPATNNKAPKPADKQPEANQPQTTPTKPQQASTQGQGPQQPQKDARKDQGAEGVKQAVAAALAKKGQKGQIKAGKKQETKKIKAQINQASAQFKRKSAGSGELNQLISQVKQRVGLQVDKVGGILFSLLTVLGLTAAAGTVVLERTGFDPAKSVIKMASRI
jgi:hypothetical protein